MKLYHSKLPATTRCAAGRRHVELERGQRDERVVVAARHPALRLARGVPQQRHTGLTMPVRADWRRRRRGRSPTNGRRTALLNVDARQIVRVVAGSAATDDEIWRPAQGPCARSAGSHPLPLRVRVEDAQ